MYTLVYNVTNMYIYISYMQEPNFADAMYPVRISVGDPMPKGTHVHQYIYIHFIYTGVQFYVRRRHVPRNTHTRIHVYMFVHIYTYIHSKHTHMYAKTDTYISYVLHVTNTHIYIHIICNKHIHTYHM